MVPWDLRGMVSPAAPAMRAAVSDRPTRTVRVRTVWRPATSGATEPGVATPDVDVTVVVDVTDVVEVVDPPFVPARDDVDASTVVVGAGAVVVVVVLVVVVVVVLGFTLSPDTGVATKLVSEVLLPT